MMMPGRIVAEGDDDAPSLSSLRAPIRMVMLEVWLQIAKRRCMNFALPLPL